MGSDDSGQLNFELYHRDSTWVVGFAFLMAVAPLLASFVNTRFRNQGNPSIKLRPRLKPNLMLAVGLAVTFVQKFGSETQLYLTVQFGFPIALLHFDIPVVICISTSLLTSSSVIYKLSFEYLASYIFYSFTLDTIMFSLILITVLPNLLVQRHTNTGGFVKIRKLLRKSAKLTLSAGPGMA